MRTKQSWVNRDVFRIAYGDNNRVWIALAGDDFSVSIHPATIDGEFAYGDEVWNSPSGGIFDIDEKWGRVWIADRTPGREGLVVLDAESGTAVGTPVDTGFPPLRLRFHRSQWSLCSLTDGRKVQSKVKCPAGQRVA